MDNLLILLTVLFGAIVVINAFNRWRRAKNSPEIDSEKILVLNSSNFDPEVKDKLILVDFWADWCAPCRIMSPILNELSSELPEGKYIGKVNIENDPSLAQKFNVRNIPTLILFQNGKEVQRFVGIKTKRFLLKVLI